MQLETETPTLPTLPRLRDLNEASRLGYDACRVLSHAGVRNGYSPNQADLHLVLEFVKLALRDLEAGYKPENHNPGQPRSYAPDEVARRVLRRIGPNESLADAGEGVLDSLRNAAGDVERHISDGTSIEPDLARRLFDTIEPVSSSYLDEATTVAASLSYQL
jgi:hypothetical protein